MKKLRKNQEKNFLIHILKFKYNFNLIYNL